MENRKLRWFLDATLGLYTLVPVALLAAFYSFVVRARMELGRWPILMEPDPKTLAFPTAHTHMDTVALLGLAALCCFLPWLLTARMRKQVITTTKWTTLGFLASPWLLVIAVLIFDPGSYVAWFLD